MAEPNQTLRSRLALERRPDPYTSLLVPEDSSRRKLELRNTKLATISMNNDCKAHIQNRCEQLDRFRKILGNAAQSATPLATESAVHDTMAEIDEIMMNAERQIQEKLRSMKKDVEKFTVEVADHADHHWYRNLEDLTAYDGMKFTELLRTMRILDYEDFTAYLKETLPTASNQIRLSHEYGETNFMDKVRILLDNVVSQAKHHDAFSLLATVKADVFVVGRARVPHRKLDSGLGYIDGQLLLLLNAHSAHAEVDDYWNFAASWRCLLNAWEQMPGDPGTLLRVVQPIRKKAEAEIRYQTDVAVNRRLPQELADLVFERAMVAAEVPLEGD